MKKKKVKGISAINPYMSPAQKKRIRKALRKLKNGH